jgi:hypothetical protein
MAKFRISEFRSLPYLIYGALSVAILGHLLLDGRILTLDSTLVFSPKVVDRFYGLSEWVMTSSAGVPADLLYHLLSRIIPVDILEKAILLLLFFLAGLGAHRLLPSGGAGAYYAGILYMINPFTYSRFLAGQWGVLWAYALTPFAIRAFNRMLDQGDTKSVVKLVFLSTLVGMIQIHGFLLLLLIFLVVYIVHLSSIRRDSPRVFRALKSAGVSVGLFCALNIYWLVPTLTAKNNLIAQIDASDMFLFAPRASSELGVVFDTISMHGFWRGGYIYTKDVLSFWWVLYLFILFLAIYGFVSSIRNKDKGRTVLSMAVISILGSFLAIGAASELTKSVFEWLWDRTIFIRGFRDSQKFLVLLCLGYACLGGLGVNAFANKLKEKGKRITRLVLVVVVTLAISTPLVYSYFMFGFHGQLDSTDYPLEWYQVDEYLNMDKDDFNVLVLPWHQYMDYSWLLNNDKRLSNPAHAFFDKQVISGDNMEYGTYSQSTNPVSRFVEFILGRGSEINNLGELLAPLNVKYVILLHEADYKAYDFLYHQTDLSIQLEKPGITLFRNGHLTTKVYAVNSVVYIDSLDEYLQLSKTQDVMQNLYLLESGDDDIARGETEELDAEVKIPVKYMLSEATSRFTIFTVPQSVNTKYWQYNEQKPLANLGFIPAFRTEPDGGEVVYERFYRVYLPSYVISISALALMIWLYFRRSRPT